ncbi:DUF2474 domain-containing protein [Pseudomonas entomophila]|nr:DUF2474 domain-containing protein [Pseudomonas entomophila]MDF0730031.1 DUF2474 domain-containing protein [Pseudomonas entomophila]
MNVEEKKPLWQRLGWLVLIWVLSVAALGLAAWVMRLFMGAAGLTTH